MNKAGIEIVKAFILATTPTLLKEVFKKANEPKPNPLEKMVDNVDWDAEYESLLNENEKKLRKKLQKKRARG